MADLDPHVASLLDRSHGPTSSGAETPSDDEDALIAALEDDTEPSALRERRLEQLHAELARAKTMRNQDHGTYSTIASEKDILDITTGTKLSVVHFFKADFARCRIMDAHLKTLAERHLDTRFVRADVESVPWLVLRLKVQVLPCLIAFVDGRSVDRILGFEGVGRGNDSITTGELERRLLDCGVLVRKKMDGDDAGGRRYNGILNGATAGRDEEGKDDDDDDDWD